MKDCEKKRASLKKVAKIAGVSASTVSRALRKHSGVSAELSCRIRAIARNAGYCADASVSRVMTAIRHSCVPQYENIALINTKQVPDITARYDAVAEIVCGIKLQAKKLGLGVSNFWLFDKSMKRVSLERQLLARGIRGGIVIGMYDNSAAEHLPSLKKFKIVSVGNENFSSIFPTVSIDKFLLVNGYVEGIFAEGFKRVGFVIEKFADTASSGKFSGGYLHAQLKAGCAEFIKPFFWNGARQGNMERLSAHIARNRIDALFSYSTDISETLRRNASRLRGVELFHFDTKFGYGSSSFKRVSNCRRIGSVAVEQLADALFSQTPLRPLKIQLPPKWSRLRSNAH